MKQLIKKEFILGWKWYNYLFFVFPLMVFIPEYPLFTSVLYMFFFVTTLFPSLIANNDFKFMSGLPIRRKDIVASKFFNILFGQTGTLFLTVVCLLIKVFVIKETALPLIDPNFAFIGMTLIEYSVFNMIFMTQYFKDLKFPKSVLLSILGFFAITGLLEVLAQVVPPFKTALDTMDVKYIGWRLAVLAVGSVAYVGGAALSFRLACERFYGYNM